MAPGAIAEFLAHKRTAATVERTMDASDSRGGCLIPRQGRPTESDSQRLEPATDAPEANGLTPNLRENAIADLGGILRQVDGQRGAVGSGSRADRNRGHSAHLDQSHAVGFLDAAHLRERSAERIAHPRQVRAAWAR